VYRKENTLKGNKRLQPDYSSYAKLGYVEKWFDLNGKRLLDGQILQLVYVDPTKIDFKNLNRTDSWMLDFLDTNADTSFKDLSLILDLDSLDTSAMEEIFRNFSVKRLKEFITPGDGLKCCKQLDIVKNKFFSLIHHFKSGIVGYSQNDKRFFILYYPYQGWFNNICIDSMDVFIDDIVKLDKTNDDIKNKHHKYGFIGINIETKKVSIIEGDFEDYIVQRGLTIE
jgi:hypothetical protein